MGRGGRVSGVGGGEKRTPPPAVPASLSCTSYASLQTVRPRPTVQPLSPHPQQPVHSPLHMHHLDPMPSLPLSKSLVHLTLPECSPSLRSVPGRPYAITILPLHPLATVLWKERFCGPFSMLGKLRFSCSRLHRDVDVIRTGRRWPARSFLWRIPWYPSPSHPPGTHSASPPWPAPHSGQPSYLPDSGFTNPTLSSRPFQATFLGLSFVNISCA